ncbi:MAG: adenine deaminase [Thermoflexales bacterium]|nr:adenine deaminase [Thermoflexales bacterium]
MDLAQLIKLARGQAEADSLLKNGRVVNVYTGEIYPADVALAGGLIVGVGPGYHAREEIDLDGRYVCPGFIDAHVHIESSMAPPNEFARAVVPRGTTTVVADPHEIANVLGLAGVDYMLEAARHNPLSVFIMMPSCVPATHMEHAGASLSWQDIAPYRDTPGVLGLAEMMNFPGVLYGVEDVLNKLRAFEGRVRDGHAPGLSGRDLAAYAAIIGSDHECTTLEEAREKIRLGMTVFIREATNAHNLEALLPLVNNANSRRMCFCTDDRQPADLLDQGHIDFILRTAIAEGLDPVTAIQMATLNPAEYFRLHDRGAVAPGKRGDLVVFSDLKDIHASLVFQDGRLAARDGHMLPWERPERLPSPPPSMNVNWDRLSFRIEAASSRGRVIGAIADQIVTEHLVQELPVRDGCVVADPGQDLAKIAVIERHAGTGNYGLGLVKGLGLARGAIASSVAHDSHNIVVAGVDDDALMLAARTVAEMGGGMAAVDGQTVLAQLPLPIAGLMSEEPIETIRAQMDAMLRASAQLGSPLHDPYMAMSFLALPVIPSLKITDKGLVDVDKFELVPLFV